LKLADRLRAHSGAGWFFVGNALPPMVAIVLGPLVLRKVGLETYAVLGLATYFFNLIVAYSDFSTSTHLLASYARRAPSRHQELGNALALKGTLFVFFAAAVAVSSRVFPRSDGLYGLLGIFMISVLLPSANVEWFFLSRKRYKDIFRARIASVAIQVLVTLAWFYSARSDALFVPLSALMAGVAASAVLVRLLGFGPLRSAVRALQGASFGGATRLLKQIFPVAAVLLVAPYSLAYALPWFSLASPDKKLVGAFSISYRLVIGAITLVAPGTLYLISRGGGRRARRSLGSALVSSALLCVGFWLIGLMILRFYFALSHLDSGLLPYSVRVFSILNVGLFFLCLRTPYVADFISAGKYRTYFMVHLVSCAPTLLLSWMVGKRMPSEWVVWLACVPEVGATLLFLFLARWLPLKRDAGNPTG